MAASFCSPAETLGKLVQADHQIGLHVDVVFDGIGQLACDGEAFLEGRDRSGDVVGVELGIAEPV
jgi:hypothetical protein